MRAPEAFDLEPVDLLRTRPALRAAQHDHGPSGPLAMRAPVASALLDGADARERNIQRIHHLRVHFFGIFAFDKQRLVPVTLKEIADLLVAHAPKHGRIGDLVTVEMEDRQDRAIARRIEKLFECQEAASGPVSASPLPTTQATIRSGLSKAAP